MKLFAAGVVTMHAFAFVYKHTARKMSGWEDDTTEEYRQKKIKEFEEANPEDRVIKLPEGENYF